MFTRGFNYESLTRRAVVTSKFNIKKKKKRKKNWHVLLIAMR